MGVPLDEVIIIRAVVFESRAVQFFRGLIDEAVQFFRGLIDEEAITIRAIVVA